MQLPAVGSYDFRGPERIIFGWGRWREVGPAAAALGRRAFLVLGSRTLRAAGVAEPLRETLTQSGVELIELAESRHEPEVADVDRAAAALRDHGPTAGDMVLAVGGGSAIDLAKAAAAMATNTQSPTVLDYLEGVGRGLKLNAPPLPLIAMPTTAGTGSEATKNAVISSYEPPFKKSLRDDGMVPKVVIVDPQWTVSAPPSVTANSGMDAITQLIESYISRKARPIPQALCVHGLQLALGAIEPAVADGSSQPAREAMAHAALLSGVALANSGLGMAHGVAAALGSSCRVSHGLACAILLPVALRVNRQVCEQQLAELAVATGLAERRDAAAGDRLIERIEQISARIGIPQRLSEVGVTSAQIPELVRGSRGNSMDGNPRSLSDEELGGILESML